MVIRDKKALIYRSQEMNAYYFLTADAKAHRESPTIHRMTPILRPTATSRPLALYA